MTNIDRQEIIDRDNNEQSATMNYNYNNNKNIQSPNHKSSKVGKVQNLNMKRNKHFIKMERETDEHPLEISNNQCSDKYCMQSFDDESTTNIYNGHHIHNEAIINYRTSPRTTSHSTTKCDKNVCESIRNKNAENKHFIDYTYNGDRSKLNNAHLVNEYRYVNNNGIENDNEPEACDFKQCFHSNRK